MLSMQLDQNGHWSHLIDLPSRGALPGTPPSVILLLKVIVNPYSDDFDVPQ